MTRGRRVGVVCVAVALGALLGAASASAAFPGANGRIAFDQGGLTPPIGGEGTDLSVPSQVFTVEPDGSGLSQLTNVASDRAAASPEWSADGQSIVYESNETPSGLFHVWVMDADGNNQEQLTHGSGFEDFQPSWSADGQRIVFSHCAEPFGFIAFCNVAEINADGSGFHNILSAGHWMNVRPQFSPNDEQITFSSDKGGLQSAVWVMNADGSSLRKLTTARLRAFWPDWAPSGKRILFADHCCLPHSNLWTVRPDGGGLRQLTHVPEGRDLSFPSYSPNGKRIVAFFGTDEGTILKTLRADGSHLHRLTGHDAFLSDWGPG
jgi:TolB protein